MFPSNTKMSPIVLRTWTCDFFSTNELSSERTELESNNFSTLHINIRIRAKTLML